MEIAKLNEWKEAVEAEIQIIKNKIQALSASLQAKGQQLELICRLIDSQNPRSDRNVSEVITFSQKVPVSQGALSSQVKDRVYEILTEVKRPMNIKDIHAQFIRRGYPIPGKGTHFNILVHIVRELKKGRNSRFQRDGRGTYSLRLSKLKKDGK
jgi:hypothetical protein